jgi:PiT family inorganic phosphate transporter
MALPLLFSPLLAMGLTVASFPVVSRWFQARSCVCLTEPAPMLASIGATAAAAPSPLPSFRVSHLADCERGDELTRWNTEELVHWASAGLISFSRGLNDTPKIAALVLSAGLLAPMMNYALVATAMALGGLLGAARVARTMSQRVTRIQPVPGLSANLVSALLVGVASRWGLPVSTTHVTMGGIFGVGARQRRNTNWPLARQIVLAWVITLPLGFLGGFGFYQLLRSIN